MPGERPNKSLGSQVPELEGLIVRAPTGRGTVGSHCHGGHLGIVAGEGMDNAAGREIPKLEDAVLGGRKCISPSGVTVTAVTSASWAKKCGSDDQFLNPTASGAVEGVRKVQCVRRASSPRHLPNLSDSRRSVELGRCADPRTGGCRQGSPKGHGVRRGSTPTQSPHKVPDERPDQGRRFAACLPEKSEMGLTQRSQPLLGAGLQEIDTHQQCAVPDLLGKKRRMEFLVRNTQVVSLALEQAEQGLGSGTELWGRRWTEFEHGDQVFLKDVHSSLDIKRLERGKCSRAVAARARHSRRKWSNWSGGV